MKDKIEQHYDDAIGRVVGDLCRAKRTIKHLEQEIIKLEGIKSRLIDGKNEIKNKKEKT